MTDDGTILEIELVELDPDGSSGAQEPARGRHRWLVIGILAVLFAQFTVIGLLQAWGDSFTFDEPFYAASGSTTIRERDMRINFEHPPLPKVLAAIPAELVGGVDIPMETGAWDSGDTWNISLQMYQANVDDIQRVTFLYRIVPTLVAAGVGILLYLLAKELFGRRAGLFAAALWLTAPIAVGYGHLNGLDVPAAFTVVLSMWLVARYVDRPTAVRLALVGLGVGVSLLTRAAVGLVVAAAMLTVVLVADLIRRNWWAPLRAVGMMVVGWLVVWIGYALIDPAGLWGEPGAWLPAAQSLPARAALLVPWPRRYEEGILFLSDFHASSESSGYLFGSAFSGAPNWFWFGSFVFKMTVGSMFAIVGGVIAWILLRDRKAAWAALVLLPMLAGLVVMMAFAERPFGARYLVPIVVILFVIASALARSVRSRWVAGGLALVIILQIGGVWASHPSTFAWSNPLLRESWQLAADSNVDWGQDFYRLKEWAADQDETVWVSYFGFGPSFDLSEIPNAISAHPYNVWGPIDLPPSTVTTYAISASNLNAFARESVGLLRDSCPVEIIGRTILVYRFEQSPGILWSPAEGVPYGLCEGSAYSMEGG